MTKEEVEEWRARDPIKSFGKKLTDDRVATQGELDKIDAEIREMVADAHTFAQESPWPDPATVLDHVYSTP